MKHVSELQWVKRFCRYCSESRGGFRGDKGEKIGRWHNRDIQMLLLQLHIHLMVNIWCLLQGIEL